jgi:hypothetical protein
MMTHERAERLMQHATAAFPLANVSGYEALIPVLTCDPSDRHVLAAAVRAQAVQIITANTRHFPVASLQPYGITAVVPDVFLLSLLDRYPETMVQVLVEQAAVLKHGDGTPFTGEEVLATLSQHVPRFVAGIRPRMMSRCKRPYSPAGVTYRARTISARDGMIEDRAIEGAQQCRAGGRSRISGSLSRKLRANCMKR